jgi:diacylglycerol kinase family enzyme
MKTLLLHNPTAGASHPTPDDLMKAARKAGLAATYQSIKDEDFKAAFGENWDLVLVAGGDGTVAKVARCLVNRGIAHRIPLVLLPVGTANNIARSLGIEGEVGGLLSGLSAAKTQYLDVGLARGPWGERNFLEAVGCGSIAEAIAHSGPKPPKPIRIEMGREALKDFLREAEAEPFEVDVDGEKFAGEFLLIEALNINLSGPALPLAFSATPDDQLLDIIFVFARDRRRMMKWLDGDPEETPPPATVLRGRKIQFMWDSAYLRIDDRVFLPPKKPSIVEVELEKERLMILNPS